MSSKKEQLKAKDEVAAAKKAKDAAAKVEPVLTPLQQLEHEVRRHSDGLVGVPPALSSERETVKRGECTSGFAHRTASQRSCRACAARLRCEWRRSQPRSTAQEPAVDVHFFPLASTVSTVSAEH